jgi:Holliday junction resolvase RusA-like endonuclease
MVELTLPIYYHTGKKNQLIGINAYERMHYHPRNKMKQWYYLQVRSQLPKTRVDGRYWVHYKLYYKNKQSDAPNIIAAVEKMAIDALQKYGVVKEDNCQYYIGASWEVVEQSKDNPRVELELTAFK